MFKKIKKVVHSEIKINFQVKGVGKVHKIKKTDISNSSEDFFYLLGITKRIRVQKMFKNVVHK